MTKHRHIDFLPLSAGNHALVRHIEVAPEQVVYCGTVDMAFRSEEEELDFYAIRNGAGCVGFFKIDLKYPRTQGFARPGDLGLRAFMVDHRHQGGGIGSGALMALPGYLARRYPQAEALVLTVNIRNQVAVRAYLKCGFRDTGEIHEGGLAGPQHVMRIPLRTKH